jgi:toxin ParE1/3/4
MNRPEIVIRPRADWDLDDLIGHFQSVSPSLAQRFIKAVGETYEFLLRWPLVGEPWVVSEERFKGLRSWPIKRFKKYVVCYRPTAVGIEVLRVVRGSRDLEAMFAGSPQ